MIGLMHKTYTNDDGVGDWVYQRFRWSNLSCHMVLKTVPVSETQCLKKRLGQWTVSRTPVREKVLQHHHKLPLYNRFFCCYADMVRRYDLDVDLFFHPHSMRRFVVWVSNQIDSVQFQSVQTRQLRTFCPVFSDFQKRIAS